MSQPSTGSNVFSKILLTILSILLIIIFKNIGVNKYWFEKTGSYWEAFKEQKDAGATIEEIKRERWGASYVVSLMAKEYFEKNKIKNPVLLVEPGDYLAENKIMNVRFPEPIVFYYYTGLKMVWMNSKNVQEANYIAYINSGGLRIEPIKSQNELQQILLKYKQYKPSL
jgi:hypothetical protein